MTKVLGTINNRQILYLDVEDNVDEFALMPLKNWILFIIEDDDRNPILYSFADLCIDKEVLYVCATGKACSEVDDLFDMIMVMREIEGQKLPSWFKTDEDVLMTSWHHDFNEGFWFATTLASYENFTIDSVLAANLTKQNYLPQIQDLVRKINEGWLPSD